MRYTLRYACHLSKVTQATVLAKTTLFAHFEAREAERCLNIFPSCSAQRKGKGVGYQEKGRYGTNGPGRSFGVGGAGGRLSRGRVAGRCSTCCKWLKQRADETIKAAACRNSLAMTLKLSQAASAQMAS